MYHTGKVEIEIRDNRDWSREDRKFIGGVIKWASWGNKKCLEKVAVLEDIEMDAFIDDMMPL